MIQLIAAIFLVVAGVTEDVPVSAFHYKNDFATRAECEAARESDLVKQGVEELRAYLAERNPGIEFVIETKCIAE